MLPPTQALSLNSMQIGTIPSDAFAGLEALSQLDLSGNPISSLQDVSVSQPPAAAQNGARRGFSSAP